MWSKTTFEFPEELSEVNLFYFKVKLCFSNFQQIASRKFEIFFRHVCQKCFLCVHLKILWYREFDKYNSYHFFRNLRKKFSEIWRKLYPEFVAKVSLELRKLHSACPGAISDKNIFLEKRFNSIRIIGPNKTFRFLFGKFSGLLLEKNANFSEEILMIIVFLSQNIEILL